MSTDEFVLFLMLVVILTLTPVAYFRNRRRRATRKPKPPHDDTLDRILRRLERIESKLNIMTWFVVTTKLRTGKIMATLDDLVAAAAAEDTKIDSLIALVIALKAKVDAIPGITPEQQAKIDAAFASITDNPQRIQDAIDANTPLEPSGN